jgi:hypothetical protein
MGDQPYAYDQDAVAGLVGAMSAPRFGTYLEAAKTETRALQLYTWSTAVAAAFYGPLQTLEVTLRNSIDRTMAASHGAHWFDDTTLLRPAEQHMVGDATQQLYDLGKQPTAGRVVAELSYGFWVGLFANGYDTTLWRTDLHRIFTPRMKQRRGLHDALDRLRTLRNRIAHHEPIFQRNLVEDYKRIRTVVGCLSPTTLAWLDHHSTAPAALATKPDEVVEF